LAQRASVTSTDAPNCLLDAAADLFSGIQSALPGLIGISVISGDTLDTLSAGGAFRTLEHLRTRSQQFLERELNGYGSPNQGSEPTFAQRTRCLPPQEASD